MRLDLHIDSRVFANQLARAIVAGGLTVIDTIERLIVEHLEDSVVTAMGDCLVRAPRAVVHDHYYDNRFENLSNLDQQGYATWYPRVSFATGKSDTIVISEIITTGFDHGYTKYGGGIERRHKYRTKELKTQINHTVQLNKFAIPSETFSDVTRIVERSSEIEQPYIANLTVGFNNFVDDRIDGFRAVSFDNVVTGSRLFCSCHELAHAAMLRDAKNRAPSYAPDAWPCRVITLLESATYSDGLCHFCVSATHGEEAVSDWYGLQIQKHYAPYVDLLTRSTHMDVRTARAEAKRRLSISRWVREDELYRLVANLFPSTTIRREASPPWLGHQRLDILLPELDLAIEHQGEQHYRPVEAFGGVAAFAKSQERDARKRALCKKHGVTVVDIRFDAPLTVPALRSRLERWIVQSEK